MHVTQGIKIGTSNQRGTVCALTQLFSVMTLHKKISYIFVDRDSVRDC
jgi:hypothetical protein